MPKPVATAESTASAELPYISAFNLPTHPMTTSDDWLQVGQACPLSP